MNIFDIEGSNILWLVALVKHTPPRTQCCVLMLSRWWWQLCCVLLAVTQPHSWPNCSLIIIDFQLIGEIFHCNNFQSSRHKNMCLSITRFNNALIQLPCCMSVVFYHYNLAVSRELSSLGQSTGIPDGYIRPVCLCVCELCTYMSSRCMWPLSDSVKSFSKP